VDLTSDDVRDILALLDDLPFGEMHLKTARFSLVLRRAADGQWTQETRVLAEPTELPASEGAPAGPGAAGPGPARPGADGDCAGGHPAAGSQAAGAGAGPGQTDGLVAVRTPLPGTFYRAPRPGAEPFVDVGSLVEPDTVVAIVETMKLMNSVSAGVTGTIARILLANAEPAERDAVLMLIREER
jgi:acetyl-CoA carboxylase biotin carboxyl carrier protein